jgi:hypothetical protein
MSLAAPSDHRSLPDDEFLARFEARSLEAFSHRDHIRVEHAYARRGGADAAVAGARRIRALAEAAGNGGKYHETMTVAWARVVARLVEERPELSFDEFVAAHPQLQDRALLCAHYSRSRLSSDEARARFLEPDLLALP